jgi:NitT/TauT family transport system permease protein
VPEDAVGTRPPIIGPVAVGHTTETSLDMESLAAASAMRSRARRRRRNLLVHVCQVLVVAAAFGLWQLLAELNVLDDTFYSRPSEVFKFLWDQRDLFLSNTEATFEATFVGFALGSALGITAGLILARFRTLDRILDPPLMALNSLPRIALVPMFLLWLGITFQAKVAQAVTLDFFILLISTRTGIREVDPDLVLEGRLLHGSNYQIYRHILLPAALPTIASGMRLGVTYALLGVIASEMIASRNGLGQQITTYGQTLQSAGVFATLIILAVIASILLVLVKRLEAIVQRHHQD